MRMVVSAYPQKYPRCRTYPLRSDKDEGVPSTWLEKFQAVDSIGLNGLIHRRWGPSTTIYYSFKENKRKTKGKLGKVSYLENFQTVKSQASSAEVSGAEQFSKYAAHHLSIPLPYGRGHPITWGAWSQHCRTDLEFDHTERGAVRKCTAQHRC
jgi:hypothetical protein